MKQYLIGLIIFFEALLTVFMPVRSRGQASVGINISKSFPSPEVASLGNYGLIPTNTYTGQADISIPLYEVSYKDLSVPLTLSYSTSGNRPEEHPGWTGLGWTLKAGGVIYRKVNGLYDECPEFAGYASETGYLYNCGRITQNYANIDSINAYAYNGTASTVVNAYDALPDEFIFNFNGYSGSFYFARATPAGALQIKIRSGGDYRLKAELLEIRSGITFNDFIPGIVGNTFKTRSSDRSIYKIKITDDKGVQYIFGGNENAIEFSNNGSFSDPHNNIASAWHLTEIKSPAGYKISLNYKKAGRTFIQRIQRNIFVYNDSSEIHGHFLIFQVKSQTTDIVASSSEAYFVSVNSPSYLSSITTPSQTVNFTSSKSTELNYPLDVETMTRLHATTNEGADNNRDSSYWQKLDVIDIVGIKKIKFNYLNHPSRRLQLTSLESQTKFDRTVQQYTFSYNPLLLPPYNIRKADHWGYYNGKSYAYDINYVTTRAPDATFMKAEMLEKITYPTGGYTQLQYEPHYYRKVARQFPFVVDTQTADSMAGGLRVKKIISAADPNAAPVSKEYFYITNYLNGGTSSSGLLSGRPEYVDSGSIRTAFNDHNSDFLSGAWGAAALYYGRVLDNNFLPLSTTNGNHITYSEVTEKIDGGYTVYKYSNHDNGYHDLAPARTVTNYTSAWHEEGFTTMEGFRGLLLLNQVYNNNKQLLKADSFEYNIDTSSIEYKVPYFCRLWNLQGIGDGMSRVSVCFFFTKPPLVKKITETNYVPGSVGVPLTVTRSNKYFNDVNTTSLAKSYDNYKVAETMSNTSRQEVLRTVFSYPYSRIAGANDPGGIYKAMIDSNINSPVVGQVEFRDAAQLRLTNISYYQAWTGLYLPKYSQTQQGTGSLDTEVTVDSYDQYGNILEATKRGGEKVAYIWDCIGHYPVAVVKNAGVGDIRYLSFEENNSNACGNTSFDRTDITAPSGIKCYELNGSNQFVITNFQGGTFRNIPHIVSYWSKNNTVSVDGTVSKVTGKTLNGWTYYEHTIQNVTGPQIRGTGLIDDVRVYPVNAQMTTFTYLPNVGMTSQCDPKNQYEYYEYDGFGRLHIIRNQDKNITKLICYNYKGEVELCNEQAYYSTVQSDSARFNCNPGFLSKMVVYTVAAGKYFSNISQQDADAKARAEAYDSIHTGTYLGLHSDCLRYNQRMTGTAIKECPSGFIGTSVTYVVDSMKYLDTSIALANEAAAQEIRANSQNYANANGQCLACNVFFSAKPGSGDLGTMNVNIKNAAGVTLYNKTFSDPTSQFPNCQSIAAASGYTVTISSMGTIYATVNGTERLVNSTPVTWNVASNVNIVFSTTAATVFKSAASSRSYQRTNCTNDSIGSFVSYVIPENMYSSTISQQYVDSFVRVYSDANGPAYANMYGLCSPAGTNVSIRQWSGANEVPGSYSITFKRASDNVTVLTLSYLTLDGNLPLFRTLPDGTYTIQISGQQSFRASVNGDEKTPGTTVQTWNKGTPISIIVGAL